MDAYGSRLLAARIRAGVRIGSEIEFTGGSGHGRLRPGDRGTVQAIEDSGNVVVVWERGFALEIDPDATQYQALAA